MHLSYSLNSFKGGYIWGIKGDTRSLDLDYSSYEFTCPEAQYPLSRE